MAKAKLTDKQAAFVYEYIQCLNATEAARRAKYQGDDATLASVGYENLRKPHIKAEIEAMLAEKAMSANEVIARLSEQARADFSDFVNVYGKVSVLDLDKARELGKLHLIKKIKYNDKGGMEVELHDAQSAQKTLAQYHGLLKQHIQIDVNLVVGVIEALEELGQDPATVFNEIIARAARARQHQLAE